MLAEGWGCHKFTDTGEVVIKAAAGNGSFELSVRDTGPGISVSDQAKLFQEFQQAEKPARRRAPDWGSPYPSASSRCVGDEFGSSHSSDKVRRVLSPCLRRCRSKPSRRQTSSS